MKVKILGAGPNGDKAVHDGTGRKYQINEIVNIDDSSAKILIDAGQVEEVKETKPTGRKKNETAS